MQILSRYYLKIQLSGHDGFLCPFIECLARTFVLAHAGDNKGGMLVEALQLGTSWIFYW